LMAVGSKARELAQRQVHNAEVIEPIKRGAVAEFGVTVTMLRAFVSQAMERRPLLSPAAIVSAPAETTAVQHRALRDAVRAAGLSRVHVVAKSLAAAVGAGVPVEQAQSVLTIDLGAGVTEIGVASGGMLTMARSLPYGGIDLDERLCRHLRRYAGIQISRAAAEDIKLQVSAVDPTLARNSLNLSGMMPPGVEFKMAASDLAVFLAEAVEPIVEEVRWVIEQLAPKQRAEIEESGAVLTGGGACLRGLPELISTQLGIRVRVADDPLAATILGLASIAKEAKHLSIDGEHNVSLSLTSAVY
jgi:rod shape-determining protein MreB